VDVDKISKRVSGKCVAHVEESADGSLKICFVDGSALLIDRQSQGWAADFASPEVVVKCPAALWPTSRQSEYLQFIEKYMWRFGVSPAESDIQRHFLVSAPSVNQMIQMLERRGFIVRHRGVPRSIRLVDPKRCASCGGVHHIALKTSEA